MTIDELLALMVEDDGTEETLNTVVKVLPEILVNASDFFGSEDDLICHCALKLATHVVAKPYDEDNAKVFLKDLAFIAYYLLDEVEGLSPETIKRLETIMDTLPELCEAEDK